MMAMMESFLAEDQLRGSLGSEELRCNQYTKRARRKHGNIRLWDQNDIRVFSSAVFQASRRFCPLMLLFGKYHSSRNMAEVFVLQNPEETHGGDSLTEERCVDRSPTE
jgi:hypothetical protein